MDFAIQGSRPIWQQLTEQLARRIITGAYPLGSRFPAVRELAAEAGDVVAAHDLHRDTERAGLLGEGTVPEADQLGGDGLVEVSQQAEDVGLGPAGVAAADEMDDLHRKHLSSAARNLGLCIPEKYGTIPGVRFPYRRPSDA